MLVLIGSFRKDGNTSRIADLIKEQIVSSAHKEKITVDIEKIQLGHTDIRICRGCRICFDRGEEKCSLKDELLSIRDKMLEADGIIAASPVYVENVSGIMKNWIDRMAFNCHRPAFAGKIAYIFATSGIGSSNNAINAIKTAFSTWGIKVAGENKFRTGELMSYDEMKTRYQKAIRKAAERFLRAIKEDSGKKPSFYSLLVFKIQQSYWQNADKHQDTIDYKYWQENGWLQRSCKYYIPHRASRMKTITARFIGIIIASFII
ncbi:MAG: flavodoxin family protein [Clostridia bacterium]|nr:flavodoxin family protein [Clostridia bacterium]